MRERRRGREKGERERKRERGQNNEIYVEIIQPGSTVTVICMPWKLVSYRDDTGNMEEGTERK